MSEVHEIHPTTGARVPVELGCARELRFTIEAGTARLYVLGTG